MRRLPRSLRSWFAFPLLAFGVEAQARDGGAPEIAIQPPPTADEQARGRRLLEPPPLPPPPLLGQHPGPPGPPAEPPLLPWFIAGGELVIMVALGTYALRQRQLRDEAVREQSRMKSYLATIKRGGPERLPGGTKQPGDAPRSEEG